MPRICFRLWPTANTYNRSTGAVILPLNTLNHFADHWLPGSEVLYSIIFGWTFLPRHCTFVFCTCANFSHPQPPTAQRPTFYETSTSSSLLEQSSYESALMTFMLILAKNCHLLVVFSMPLRTLQSPLFRHLFLRLLNPIWCCYILYRSCFTDPSPNIPGLLLSSVLSLAHDTEVRCTKGLRKWPQDTLFTSLSLFQCDYS